jgi:AraC-like DNA-binding protein
MPLMCHIPRPPLDKFVETFWLWEGVTRPHSRERILPDGSMQIIINLAADRVPLYDRDTGELRGSTRGVLLCGPRSTYSVIDTSSQLSVLGFHFKPGGMLPFLRMPLDEFHDEEIGLDCLWGRVADELRDRVLSARGRAAMFEAAEQYLLERAVRGFERHPAVAFAICELCGYCDVSISSITDRTGLSSRRFAEVFRQEIGMNPKVFSRVHRFQRAVRTVGGDGQNIDWADVALACGYYDQAHFIHDFREFSGLAPSTYLRTRTEHLNHVPFEP